MTGPHRVLLIRDARWNCRTYHPHRPQLLTAGADGWVIAWDLEQGRELARAAFEATPERMEYSPDGNRVVACYRRTDGWGVSVHRAEDGSLLTSQVFANRPSSLDWHPAGRWIAVTDLGGVVQLMDSRTGEIRTLGRQKAESVNAVFSTPGDYLITGSWGSELACWDVRSMQRAFAIGLDSFVGQFRDDGSACAFVTRTGIQIHSFVRPSAHRDFAQDLGVRWRHAALSPDGRWFAATSDKNLSVWDLSGHGPAARVEEGYDTFVFWTKDGRELLGSRGSECFRWQVEPATNASAPPRMRPMPLFRPDGLISMSLNEDRIAWTTSRGSWVSQLQNAANEGDRWFHTVPGGNALSPDGRWLAVYRPFTPYFHVYEVGTANPVATLTNQGAVTGLKFSPLGDALVAASRGQVEFWSTTDWQRTRFLTNFTGNPYVSALFAPAGHAIWLMKNYRDAGLYDARTLEPILPLPAGTIPLATSADGRHLAVVVDAHRLKVWDLADVHLQLSDLGLDYEEP
jgi:WD40 repeat protein